MPGAAVEGAGALHAPCLSCMQVPAAVATTPSSATSEGECPPWLHCCPHELSVELPARAPSVHLAARLFVAAWSHWQSPEASPCALQGRLARSLQPTRATSLQPPRVISLLQKVSCSAQTTSFKVCYPTYQEAACVGVIASELSLHPCKVVAAQGASHCCAGQALFCISQCLTKACLSLHPGAAPFQTLHNAMCHSLQNLQLMLILPQPAPQAQSRPWHQGTAAGSCSSRKAFPPLWTRQRLKHGQQHALPAVDMHICGLLQAADQMARAGSAS